MLWFGYDPEDGMRPPATFELEQQIPVPVGTQCGFCSVEFREYSKGYSMPMVGPTGSITLFPVHEYCLGSHLLGYETTVAMVQAGRISDNDRGPEPEEEQ
jgi:hypothetical protein